MVHPVRVLFAHGTAGASRRPAFPAPFLNERAQRREQSSGEMSRENAEVCLQVGKRIGDRGASTCSASVGRVVHDYIRQAEAAATGLAAE
nr:hypothetical protein CIT39_11685 [Bradyrhizobium symbiodeficiens]